jgi:hypothetical protein
VQVPPDRVNRELSRADAWRERLMARLLTPLVPVTVASIYNNAALPGRMAKCTPDTAVGLQGIVDDLRGRGHDLRLSDLFRSYEMQRQAHLDFVEKRKKAFSPPPGGSMHEAGRAMDIDLSSMGVTLEEFWGIARGHGFFPIIDAPIPSRSESWHFDCRGSHDLIYQYVKAGKAGASIAPYTQMAMSGILAIGVQVDALPDLGIGALQSALIRLGLDPGRIDGVMGDRTLGAMREAGLDPDDPLGSADLALKQKFPGEY